MAHKLFPPEGQSFLSPEDAVARLRDEFRHVEADPDGGADHVGDMLVQFFRMKQHGSLPSAPLDAMIDALQRARARAIEVRVFDDPSAADDLSFVLIPDEAVFFGYSSAQHEAACRPNLERVAAALGYEIVLV